MGYGRVIYRESDACLTAQASVYGSQAQGESHMRFTNASVSPYKSPEYVVRELARKHATICPQHVADQSVAQIVLHCLVLHCLLVMA